MYYSDLELSEIFIYWIFFFQVFHTAVHIALSFHSWRRLSSWTMLLIMLFDVEGEYKNRSCGYLYGVQQKWSFPFVFAEIKKVGWKVHMLTNTLV